MAETTALKTVRTMEDLCDIIEDIGFLPFFANEIKEIKGFSLEECVIPRLWYVGNDDWPVWEWKGPVIQKTGCAYGAFFKNRAGFISRKYYPDFANYRRDGYDFDARYEDGLARHTDKEIYDTLEGGGSMLSCDLKRAGGFGGKNGKKGFEGAVTRLQMQGYIITENFEQRISRSGNAYGWGVARYTTPERFFGKKFTDNVYAREPEESLQRILKRLSKKLGVPESELIKIIG